MTRPIKPPQYLSVREVAALWGVSKMTVYRLIHDQTLRAHRIRAAYLIDARDADALWRDSNTIDWERP